MSLHNELLQPEIRRDSSSSAHQYGKFITGGAGSSTTDTSTNSADSKIPYVFLKRSDDDTPTPTLIEHYLIAYRILNATLVLLIPISDASNNVTVDFYQNFDSFVGTQMTTLASNLVDAYGKDKDDTATSPHQFLYYNNVNASLLSTFTERNVPSASAAVSGGSSSSSQPIVPFELYGVLTDLREEITNASYFGDVIAKSDDDYWVAAKKCDDREIYALIYHKNANLTEIHDEMRKLCSNKFENKFLLE